MLPKDALTEKCTIYINPEFKNVNRITSTILQNQQMSARTRSNSQQNFTAAHINPLFLPQMRRTPAVHMNPVFFERKLLDQQLILEQQRQQNELLRMQNASQEIAKARQIAEETAKNILQQEKPLKKAIPANSKQDVDVNRPRKIITNTRLRIVREALPVLKASTTSTPSTVQPLLKLTRRKLVRQSACPSAGSLKAPISLLEAAPTAAISTNLNRKYKLDNRKVRPFNLTNTTTPVKVRNRSFVGRYALRRLDQRGDKKLLPTQSKKSINTILRKSAPYKSTTSLPCNKKLQLLNINGVLYKSTRNKLLRKDVTIGSSMPKAHLIKSNNIVKSTTHNKTVTKKTSDRVLFVRGTKFILDSKGLKLTRASLQPTLSKNQRQRIDIGGLTYIASKTNNVFVRTRNHLAMAHLTSAKHRSLNLLTRRHVKSNVPCPIYQRIGKCVAHERNKCSKVHDKRQIAICSKFLRGDCDNLNCLLSHNVSLAKMPVCKFYLQGVCVRNDCPYLHKKLSQNTDICMDFLRGYCKLADQCNKRHEFLCPEFERKGKCEIRNCMNCKQKAWQDKRHEMLKIKQQSKEVTTSNSDKNATEIESETKARYFAGEQPTIESIAPESENEDETVIDTAETENCFARRKRPKLGKLPSFISIK